MSSARTYTVSEARNQLKEVVNRVTYTEQPAVITKHGTEAVAIIPYRMLELLLQVEAILDLNKGEKAFADFEAEGGECLDDLKAKLGLK